ncbi:hypothetical protein AB1Y20_011480 [Prymnesium parvum]|uniref:Major facilitator superfamily (MFS) profile domain-containing protein n=1 Tax=Prymnesium parvum TaxID=97485 RepID=A0AB34IHA2_PRYPA
MSSPGVQRGVQTVAFILFLDAVAGALGVSVLPYFVTSLGGTAAQFGAILSTFAAANVVASLWIGAASDMFGRKALLLLSLAGLALGFALTAAASSVFMLTIARGTLGFFAGVGSTGRAYVADVCPAEERAALMARLSGLMMFGYAGGPPLGAAISAAAAALGLGGAATLRAPFAVGCGGALLALLVAAAALPSVRQTGAPPPPPPPPPGGGGVRAAGGVALLLLASALGQPATACFLVLQPLLIADAFGWGAAHFSLMMSAYILAMAVVQIALFEGVQKRPILSVRQVGLLRLGVLAFIGSSPIVPVAIARLASGNLGYMMGLASTAEQIGRVFAPTLLSAVYGWSPAASFQLTAALLLCGALSYAAAIALVGDGGDSQRPPRSFKRAAELVRQQLAVARAFWDVMRKGPPAEGHAALQRKLTEHALAVEGVFFLTRSRHDTEMSATNYEEAPAGEGSRNHERELL